MRTKIFLIVISAAVIGAVVAALVNIGSPKTERARRFDGIRRSDLQTLQMRIGDFLATTKKLPENLGELNAEYPYVPELKDPETSAPYIYEKKSENTFTLCTSFAFENNASEPDYRTPINPPAGTPSVREWNWSHPAGPFCFSRTVELES